MGRSQLDYLSSIEENGKNHHPLTYSLSLFSLPNKNVDVKLSMFVLIKNFSSNEHCNAQPTKGPLGFGLCGPRAP